MNQQDLSVILCAVYHRTTEILPNMTCYDFSSVSQVQFLFHWAFKSLINLSLLFRCNRLFIRRADEARYEGYQNIVFVTWKWLVAILVNVKKTRQSYTCVGWQQ